MSAVWKAVAPGRAEAATLLTMLALNLLACLSYAGSRPLFLAYGLAVMLIVRAMFRRRGSVFMWALFSFLTLGCWTKLVAHLLLGTALMEPVGRFDGSPASWDTALAVLLVAFSALLACSFLVPRAGIPASASAGNGPVAASLPGGRWLPWLSGLAALFSAALLLFNFHFSILKIGTVPTLQLHSHAYVLVSFMVAWGNVMLLSTLLFWMIAQGRARPAALFYLFGILGALTAVSMGSRAQMVLYVCVPVAIFLAQGRQPRWRMRAAQWALMGLVLALAFVLSLVAVSADRLASFAQARPVVAAAAPAAHTVAERPASTPAASAPVEAAPVVPVPPAVASAPVPPMNEAVRAQQRKGMLVQVSRLVLDRWLGLEGVLAVTGHPDRGPALLREGLREDPARGAQAIYQRMAGSQYAAYENFVFMTIPGPIALLYYSGSLVVVALGMALLFIAGWAIEALAIRLTCNAAASGTAGVALAYLVVQANFPRVLFFFALEMLLFVAGLAVLRALALRFGARAGANSQPPSPGAPVP